MTHPYLTVLAAVLSACSASWPRDLGTHDLDNVPAASSARLSHLAEAMHAPASTAKELFRANKLSMQAAPDPTALLARMHAEHRALPSLDDNAVLLRIVTYNVGLLDRTYLGTQVAVPHGAARRRALLASLFEQDADVLLLQEMWEWHDALQFAAAAQAAGWTWYAGSPKRHQEHGLFVAVRKSLVLGELSGEEHQFRAQRKLEHWPGPNVKRGWLHATFQLAGTDRTVHLIDTHATSYPQFWRVRNMQARQVGLSIEPVPDDDIVVLGGDLNAGPYYHADSWVNTEGEAHGAWWQNASAYALWLHYGDFVDAHALHAVPADVVQGRTLPANPAVDATQPYGSTTWCQTVDPDVFTGTECNSHYMAQYAGTEFPARLDHVFVRDRHHHARVTGSRVVYRERYDLGTAEPIEWSDHYGLRVDLLVR